MFKVLFYSILYCLVAGNLFSVTNFISEDEKIAKQIVEADRKNGLPRTEIDYFHSNIFKNLVQIKNLINNEFYKKITEKYLNDKILFENIEKIKPIFYIDANGREYFKASLPLTYSFANYPQEIFSKSFDIYIYFTNEKITKVVILVQENSLESKSYFKTLKRFTHNQPTLIDLNNFQGKKAGSNDQIQLEYFSGIDIELSYGWKSDPNITAKPSMTLILSDPFLSYTQQVKILELYKNMLQMSNLAIQQELIKVKARFHSMFEKFN